ncbi:response regulator [Paenibacillus naphthalenovorans]|uniref:response regulator transcription factor n=1 Tax=Paenibacillus naphthalenovorans TaxID=162209 RepID=UPI003D2AA979
MINVLIADDEILVRIGLKTIIPWEENGFRLVGEASDGNEALAVMERTPCDIVLTDIRMPGCDGLELIERIKEKYPGAKCLILSSHNDFEYVQKALRLGAVDYILKLAMEPEELLAKLIRLKEEIEAQRVSASAATRLEMQAHLYGKEVKEKRMRDLLTKQCTPGEIRATFEEFHIPPFTPPYRIVNLQLDAYEEVLEENNFQSEKLLSYTVANILTEILRKYDEGELVEIEGGRFAVITDYMEADMLLEMQEAVRTFLKLSVSVGYSDSLMSTDELHTGYLQAKTALEHRFYRGMGGIIAFDSLHYASPLETHVPWTQAQWIQLIEKQDEAGVLALLDRWTDSLREGPFRSPDMLREEWVELVHIFGHGLRPLKGDLYAVPPYRNRYPLHAVRQIETLEELYTWFCGWTGGYFQYYKTLATQQWRPEIAAVVRRIREHYNEPLKVSELAKEIGFTENYLSVLFKRETGETIMDFITRIRMDKARELLKNQHYKVYEIAEKVGYTDTNYFSKLFKKVEGIHPLEYRKTVLGRK